MDTVSIKRALLSVSDKTGLIELAKTLQSLDIEILSTGGTFKLLQQHQIPTIEISSYTDFPELMQGRVKTLHPKIHGGILGRRGLDDKVMAQHQIKPIDLVVVNLYPFEAVTQDSNCDLATAIENIDIGGPTLIRAAAKNYQYVTVLVDPKDYPGFIKALNTPDALSAAQRFEFAAKAFEHVAYYDDIIANYFGRQLNKESGFPRTFNMQFTKLEEMRYGENPHQAAAFYREKKLAKGCIADAKQLHGRTLSYNNIVDADTALECVKQFKEPACVIVKHANPCGVAIGTTLLDAYQKAYHTDPTSAFGGIIACNQTLDSQTLQAIIAQQFVEVIIAPSIEPDAITLLETKPNIRLLESGHWEQPVNSSWDCKRINGGLLLQDYDSYSVSEANLTVVTARTPTLGELQDLLFSWKVAKFVKSNAIVYAKTLRTIGIGAGQMSRVYSAKIASMKAAAEQLEVKGSVMASDAFFPFRDGIDTAATAGITAIIQPGGSIKDKEVIAAANEANMAMVFTGIRHFRH